MSQARRTRHLLKARNECEARERGIKKDKALFFPPLVAFRASHKMPLSLSLAHKAGAPCEISVRRSKHCLGFSIA